MKKMTIKQYKQEIRMLNAKIDELVRKNDIREGMNNNIANECNQLKSENNILKSDLIKLKNRETVLMNDLEREKNITRQAISDKEKDLKDKLFNAEQVMTVMQQNHNAFIQRLTGIHIY